MFLYKKKVFARKRNLVKRAKKIDFYFDLVIVFYLKVIVSYKLKHRMLINL